MTLTSHSMGGGSGSWLLAPGSWLSCCILVPSECAVAVTDVAEDNLLCRQLHVPMVPLRPEVHCPHIGPSGGDMCIPRCVVLVRSHSSSPPSILRVFRGEINQAGPWVVGALPPYTRRCN
jgi:hypothetical protein